MTAVVLPREALWTPPSLRDSIADVDRAYRRFKRWWITRERAGVVAAIGTPVSLGSANSAAAATTIAFTLGTAVSTGDDIFVFSATTTAGTTCTFSDSKVNTWATDASANATQNACFFIGHARCTVAMTTSDTITATFSASRTDRLIAGVSVSGIASASALDKTATQAQSLSGAAAWSSSNTATTTQADELVIGGSTDNDGSTVTSTPGASLTELFDFANANSICMTVVYRIVSSTAAYSANGTWATSGFTKPLNSAVATYKAAAAGSFMPRPLQTAMQAVNRGASY